jgi:PTS system nitrogen regulatory IIA component
MEIIDILRPEAVLAGLKANSKKHVVQELSRHAAGIIGIDEHRIFETLMERERLGTTGVGNGIAIPHGKIKNLDGLHGVFAHLDKPIDFAAIDEHPVDLIFLLLAPEGAGSDHLKALARVSRLLRGAAVCKKLRGADTADGLYMLLTQSEAQAA